MKIWGNPSPFWLNSSKINHMVQHKYVSFDEKCKAFLGAKIVINNLHPTEINSLNARTFEVAATSAFQLVNYRDSAISLFEPDKEMVYFTDLKDMKEKVAFYLQHPEERLRIGNASMKRSVTDHTFTKRISTLLSIVFDNERNYPKVQRN